MSKINATEVVKFAIYLAVIAVAVVLWFPGVAQEKVDTHVEQSEKIDAPHEAGQDKKIDELDGKVDRLVTAQAVANSELRATRETIKALIEEIKKGRIR